MDTLLRSFCAMVVVGALVGCASSSSSAGNNRPSVYRGGQYYGDAWHAGDTGGFAGTSASTGSTNSQQAGSGPDGNNQSAR